MTTTSHAPVPLPPTPSIPKELLEEITGCQVLSYLIEDGSSPGDGFMSVLYSVSAELIVPTEEGEPMKEMQHFLFKCYPRHPSRQSYLSKTNMFYNELAFYRIWAKALRDFQIDVVGLSEDDLLTPAFPPFVGGTAIDFLEGVGNGGQDKGKIYKPLDNYFVMTDLRKSGGYKMVDKALGLDLDHLVLAFTELARMHALGWAYKNRVEWDVLKKFPFLKVRLDEEDKAVWQNIVASNVDIAVKTMDGALGEGNRLSKSSKDFAGKLKSFISYFLEQSEEIESQLWSMHRSPPKEMVEASKTDKPWRLQCHGDAWVNNLLFQYNQATGKPESVILFDFQLTREGCPTTEFAYLVYTSTNPQFRKTHLDSLLQLYCDKFLGFCEHLKVPPLPGFGSTPSSGDFIGPNLLVT